MHNETERGGEGASAGSSSTLVLVCVKKEEEVVEHLNYLEKVCFPSAVTSGETCSEAIKSNLIHCMETCNK